MRTTSLAASQALPTVALALTVAALPVEFLARVVRDVRPMMVELLSCASGSCSRTTALGKWNWRGLKDGSCSGSC